MLKFALTALMLLGLPAAAAAHPEDAGINAVYGRLVEARAKGDVAAMVAEFPEAAILVDARPGPPLGGGGELAERLRPAVAQLAKEGVQLRTQYRVERRSVGDGVAVDAGYMRMEMTRPGGQMSARHSRFLVTLQRDEGGRWRIIGDASMPADEAAWTSAQRRPGLRYDG